MKEFTDEHDIMSLGLKRLTQANFPRKMLNCWLNLCESYRNLSHAFYDTQTMKSVMHVAEYLYCLCYVWRAHIKCMRVIDHPI